MAFGLNSWMYYFTCGRSKSKVDRLGISASVLYKDTLHIDAQLFFLFTVTANCTRIKYVDNFFSEHRDDTLEIRRCDAYANQNQDVQKKTFKGIQKSHC